MTTKKSDLIENEIKTILEKYNVCSEASKLIMEEVEQLCNIAEGEEDNYFNWKGE